MQKIAPPLRVLLVDDEPAIQRTLRVLLAEDGLLLTSASTVAEARRALGGEAFDVLVADYLLPDGNGADLIEWTASRSPAIASVLWTGMTNSELVELARAEKAVVVQKPAHTHELVTAIRKALALKRRTA